MIFGLRTLTLMLLVFLSNCSKSNAPSSSGGGAPASSEPPAGPGINNIKSDTIEGTISYILNLLLPSTYADESTSICSSTCNSSNCAELYTIDNNGNGTLICSTNLIGTSAPYSYRFDLLPGALDSKLIKIKAILGSNVFREQLILKEAAKKLELNIDEASNSFSKLLELRLKNTGTYASNSYLNLKDALETNSIGAFKEIKSVSYFDLNQRITGSISPSDHDIKFAELYSSEHQSRMNLFSSRVISGLGDLGRRFSIDFFSDGARYLGQIYYRSPNYYIHNAIQSEYDANIRAYYGAYGPTAVSPMIVIRESPPDVYGGINTIYEHNTFIHGPYGSKIYHVGRDQNDADFYLMPNMSSTELYAMKMESHSKSGFTSLGSPVLFASENLKKLMTFYNIGGRVSMSAYPLGDIDGDNHPDALIFRYYGHMNVFSDDSITRSFSAVDFYSTNQNNVTNLIFNENEYSNPSPECMLNSIAREKTLYAKNGSFVTLSQKRDIGMNQLKLKITTWKKGESFGELTRSDAEIALDIEKDFLPNQTLNIRCPLGENKIALGRFLSENTIELVVLTERGLRLFDASSGIELKFLKNPLRNITLNNFTIKKLLDVNQNKKEELLINNSEFIKWFEFSSE